MMHVARWMNGGRSELRGTHMLAVFVVFFGVIFAVNGYFLYVAISTHAGLAAVEPYRKGLAYNDRIAADDAQTLLRWSAELKLDRAGMLVLSLHDDAGAPIANRRVAATIGRPSTVRFDQALALKEIGPGVYAAQATDVGAGTWVATADVRTASGREPDSDEEATVAEAVSLQGAAFDPVSVRPVAQAKPTVTTLVVENMHCGNCMRSVEHALEAVPGVTSARVNLSAGALMSSRNYRRRHASHF